MRKTVIVLQRGLAVGAFAGMGVTPPAVDLESVKAAVLAELRQPQPVIVLPDGVHLSHFECECGGGDDCGGGGAAACGPVGLFVGPAGDAGPSKYMGYD